LFRPKVRKILAVGFLLFSHSTAYSEEVKYYCVQVISTKNYTRKLEKDFYILKGFPDRRIEKIDSYYTLRIGFWKSKREAKKYYSILKKKFPGALLRTCYKIPSRWVLPKNSIHHLSTTNLIVGIKKLQKSLGSNKMNYKELAIKYYTSYTPSAPEFKTFLFPQTRTGKAKRNKFGIESSYNSLLFKKDGFLKESFFIENTKGVIGFSYIKDNSQSYELFIPKLTFFKKSLDPTELFTVKAGIFQRKTYLENLSAPTVSISWKAFPTSGEFSIGYTIKNGYNDIDLRKLLFSSLYLNYKLTPKITLLTSTLTENLVKRKISFYPFKERTWFSTGIKYNNSGSITFITSSKGGYLTDLILIPYTKKELTTILGLSVDKNLPLPLASKGKIHTEMAQDYLFNPDPLNLRRLFLKISTNNYGIALNFYRLSSKKCILGEKFYHFEENGFLGTSFGGFYRLSFRNLDLDLFGGIFLPGTVFSDKSLKASGGFNLRGSW